MPSTTFYLKYRPQVLDNLIGQTNVKNILISAFKNEKIAHAYLLVGPRGTGKTSTARILAKMVNCSAKQNGVPCNKCSICISITDGSNLDLIEIDAASNRGIEDIRALRETIKLSPSISSKKVYIIDEVHMLTTEAFNALLKTLEEPPTHALFILATTDISKVPQTIVSRVQRLDFSLAMYSELKEALQKIIKAEKIDIEDNALEIIIKRADGSFRDGVKLLDQFSSLKKITASDVLENLRTFGFEEIINLLKIFSTHDASKSLLETSKLLASGIEVRELILSIMGLMRDMMLINNSLGTRLVESKYTSDKYSLIADLASQFTTQDLAAGLNVLQEALTKLKFVSIQSLPLELAIVEICGEQKSLPMMNKPMVAQPLASNSDSSDDIVKLKEKWNFVLETIRPYNFSLEALLRCVNVAQCSKETIIIEVPYSFHQRILEAPKNRDILESILSEILGRSIKVSTVLGERPSRREDIANVEVAADDEIIRAAAEIFNAES